MWPNSVVLQHLGTTRDVERVKGVQGPVVDVDGVAQIPLKVGHKAFIQECIVVKDDAIDFPTDTGLIFGANFLIGNQLDISMAKWGLLKADVLISHFQPCKVNGKLFLSSSSDDHKLYLANFDDLVEIDDEGWPSLSPNEDLISTPDVEEETPIDAIQNQLPN